MSFTEDATKIVRSNQRVFAFLDEQKILNQDKYRNLMDIVVERCLNSFKA